jgi:hypothetical protein
VSAASARYVAALPNGLAPFLLALLGVVAAPVLGVVTFLALSQKRHVSFYLGADKSAPKALEILQDHKIRFPTQTYTLRDDQGRRLGVFSKNYLYSIVRKQWVVRDWRGKPVCVVKEDSDHPLAAARMLGPLLGLLRTNFVFIQFGNEARAGRVQAQDDDPRQLRARPHRRRAQGARSPAGGRPRP